MDVERARAFLLSLPYVVETMQFGDNLVFWVGDKAIGGKMFCLLDISDGTHGVASFAAGPERFFELLEQDGLIPAPYLARAHWVAEVRWNAMRPAEWEECFRIAHELTLNKLSKKTRDVLALPKKQQEQLIAARRATLAKDAPKTTVGKKPAKCARKR